MGDVIDFGKYKKPIIVPSAVVPPPPKDANKSASPTKIHSDFGDRLQRIRSSLEKINRLMSELKRMSKDTFDENDYV